jgi:hypothetical protein
MGTSIFTRRRVLGPLAFFVVLTLTAGVGAQGKKRPKPPDPPSLPADAWIAFGSGSDLWLSNGTENGLLLEGASYPAWSPGGTELACWGTDAVTGRAAIQLVNADGSGSPELVHTADYRGNGLDWSGPGAPGGEWLVFTEHPYDGDAYDLCVVRPDGSEVVRLTDDVSYDYPRWSPDGTRIAVTEFDPTQPPNLMMRLVILDVGLVGGQLAVTGRTYLTGVPGSPIQDLMPYGAAFSPDGGWVVCAQAESVLRIDLDDPAIVVPIYDAGTQAYDPVFTPDGAEVLFSVAGRRSDLLATVDAWGASTEHTFLTPGYKGDQRSPDVRE